MSVFRRLREKISRQKPKLKAPFGPSLHRGCHFALLLEDFDDMPLKYRREIKAWAEQDLWNDIWAYRILKMFRDGEIHA